MTYEDLLYTGSDSQKIVQNKHVFFHYIIFEYDEMLMLID